MTDPSFTGLTFGDFLAKMKDPAAADLVRNIKSFIRQFEDRPAGHPVDPEADSARVQAFLGQSEQLFRQHPVWRGCQPEVLDQAVEGLEKYVMSKVWRQTFGAWQEDRERDERYQRLMQALGFVDLPTLMGADVQPDPSLLAMAQGEILKMDRYKAPRDKLLCLVNVKTMVESIVQLAAKGGAAIGGADAFFPVFLFVVIRSRMPHLAANVEYVKRFRLHSRLTGQFDYMLCNMESAAMYLDTVNYEHLAVSQQQFLQHLAAAGIPEAHLELQRMQQQQEAAAAAAADPAIDYGGSSGVATPESERGAVAAAAAAEEGAPAAAAAAASVARAAAEGAAAAALRQEQADAAAAGAVADVGDVLEGLQLAEDSSSSSLAVAAGGESAGVGSVQTSQPATPLGVPASREGSLPSLSPLGTAQSPVLLDSAAGAGAAAATATAALPAVTSSSQDGGGGAMPRGLSFHAAADLAWAAEQQEQQAEQQRQHQAEQEGWAEAAAAAAGAAEAALIEEMVAEGTRHVLAAEAAGMLQQRYPFMYAQAEDLSLMEVQAVLVGYKELLLRYEALSRSLQQQLGFGDGSGNGPSSSGSLASVPAAASRSPGHRSKLDQQQYGFGSLILPTGGGGASGGDGSMGSGGRRATSAPVAVPGSPSSSAAASGSADASPSGKWSPGGILQRISSQAQRAKRSITPPRDRGGSRATSAAAAEAGSRSPPGGAGSVGKPGQHPFFSTLFGSSGGSGSSTKVGMQQPQQLQAAGASPILQQPEEVGAGGIGSGAPSSDALEAAAGAAADGPALPGGGLPGSAAAAEQGEEAGMPADLIQLGSSNSEEAGSLQPAPAEASQQQQPREPPPPPLEPELWDDSQQGNSIVPSAALDDVAAEPSQGQASAASLI